MTILVDLLPEIEARVSEAAEAEGIDMAAYVREAMAASHPSRACVHDGTKQRYRWNEWE